MSRQPIVIGLGEVLWDEFGDVRRPGGAPANVAFQAMQLGCDARVVSRVGDDEPGHGLCRFLKERGLSTTGIPMDSELPTGRVTVDASRPGHPEFVIHENVAWDALEFTAEARSLMKSADAVCFGSLAQRCEPSRATIQACLDACPENCLRVFDVNLRQDWYSAETIDRSLMKANVVKLNSDEVRTVSTLLGINGDGPAEFCGTLRERYDINRICITRAENGCLLNDATETVEVPGAEVKVVDAVGAGDAATAALIFATLAGWPLNDTARFANEVGALTTTRTGAMADLRAEIAALVAAFVAESE